MSPETVAFNTVWNELILLVSLMFVLIYSHFKMHKIVYLRPQNASGVYAKLHMMGMRLFGRLWLPQYLGPLYPGVIPHQ